MDLTYLSGSIVHCHQWLKTLGKDSPEVLASIVFSWPPRVLMEWTGGGTELEKFGTEFVRKMDPKNVMCLVVTLLLGSFNSAVGQYSCSTTDISPELVSFHGCTLRSALGMFARHSWLPVLLLRHAMWCDSSKKLIEILFYFMENQWLLIAWLDLGCTHVWLLCSCITYKFRFLRHSNTCRWKTVWMLFGLIQAHGVDQCVAAL